MALLEVGDAGETDALAEQLSKYTSLSRFRLRPGMTEETNQRLRDSLAAYRRIIVAVSEQKLSPYQPFFSKFTTDTPVIYAFYAGENDVADTACGCPCFGGGAGT